MDSMEIGVIVGGTALTAFVLWYSFGKHEAVFARTGKSGVQEIKVTVEGGYNPDLIVVKQGRPVRLDFYRAATAYCSEWGFVTTSVSPGICRHLKRRRSNSRQAKQGNLPLPVA